MIGRVIDKYKIVEEVGQGGMSVVYKGMDTSLNREVAVKVLHPHLAGSDEARQRFEREAHAVAKLRHENILEIYDYSGRDSASSYIVTELIKGRTLRAFIGEHAIAFPEIAAMIVVEVCHALSHAHTLGVLHRDVKPENIMIREDGVLKLMDFGIAQIVDSQRMTVTGQLLGSPAYMSPEHVEGRPLDFRTDVFSVGILIYQLATGELPFKGRNPHEILKRIAECKYLDARVVNPLVADPLNRIIGKALARMPEDRYADVSVMLSDLERFLADVDVTDPRVELKRFFTRPLPYENAFKERLVDALTKRGRIEVAARRTARALDFWNRVLTIDPSNEAVLKLIDKLSRRRRMSTGLFFAGAAVALTAGGVYAYRQIEERRAARPPEPPPVVAPALPPAIVLPPDAAVVAVAPPAPPDAAVAPEITIVVPPQPDRPTPPVKPIEKPQPAITLPRMFILRPTPRNATYAVDNEKFSEPISEGDVEIPIPPGAHKITVRHPMCDDVVYAIKPDEPARPLVTPLPWKPANVTVICTRADAIAVDGKALVTGASFQVLGSKFPRTGVARLTAEFTIGGTTTPKPFDVLAGSSSEVKCDDE